MSQLPPLLERDAGKKTLVLDLDETLVHSSFKPIPNPDHVLEVEVDGELTEVFVLKRPGMDAFLAAVEPKGVRAVRSRNPRCVTGLRSALLLRRRFLPRAAQHCC